MLKIGEFARLALVTVPTLRHYDQLGLLQPELVDEASGYRYYTIDQLPSLHHILALKDLGLSLAQIRTLLAEGVTEERIRGMLHLKRVELEAQIQAQRERLLRVEARLALHRAPPPRHEVVLKRLDEQRVVMASGDLDAFGAIDGLFARVDAHLEAHGVRPIGSCLALFPDPRERARDGGPLHGVEVATPVRSPVPEGKGTAFRTLPAVPLAACALHLGAYGALPGAYGSLLGWCDRHGYRVVGPSREVYLRFGDVAALYPDAYLARSPDDFVTEVQLPVERTHDA